MLMSQFRDSLVEELEGNTVDEVSWSTRDQDIAHARDTRDQSAAVTTQDAYPSTPDLDEDGYVDVTV